MKELKEIERTIQKKYRKEIFSKFVKSIKDFNLIEENDVTNGYKTYKQNPGDAVILFAKEGRL